MKNKNSISIRTIISGLLLALISPFFTSCGLRPGSHGEISLVVNGVEFTSVQEIANRKLRVHFPLGTSSQEKALLIDGLVRQLNAFERDWGSETVPTSVFLFKKTHIPCGNRKGKFIGCHYHLTGHIHIIMDRFFAASVLYHELVHRNIKGYDPDHADPRWNSFWTPMQNQIWQQIVADHRVILGI